MKLKGAWRSLMMQKLRTFLSTIGVMFGVVAVVAMLSIGEGAKQETLEQIESLGMTNIIIRQSELSEDQLQKMREARSRGLTLEDSALIHTLPTVKAVAPIKVFEASLHSSFKEITPEVIGVDRSFFVIKQRNFKEGRAISDLDGKNRSLVCVIGEDVANALGKEGRIGGKVRIDHLVLSVIGILSSEKWKKGGASDLGSRNYNQSIIIPLGLQGSLLNKKSGLTEIIVKIDKKENVAQSALAIKRVITKAHGESEDFQLIVPEELFNQAQKTQQTFNFVLGSIAAISLLVGGIGIMNIMLATISERTKEIGLRRALGASEKDILFQFLGETLLLTLTGAIAGIIIGLLASYGISAVAGWKTIVKGWSILLSLFMATGVGLLSGVYPALKAAKMSPITALRHE